MILAAVNADRQSQSSIWEALAKVIRWLWDRHLTNPYDRTGEDRFASEVARAVDAARRQSAGSTDAYLRRTFQVLGTPTSGRTPVVDRDPRGIPAVQEWRRPVTAYRRAKLTGLDDIVAEDRAMQRAEAMADLDLAMARRDTAARRLASVGSVTGWRRVIHPEQSAGGTCGLCVVAADRFYTLAELNPIHARCKCTVMPVVAGKPDPGYTLNRQTLDTLYKAAGGTAGAKLKRVRVAVAQHGEIGPVLVDERHQFRGPDQVRKDAPDLAKQARTELASLEKTLADLERREASGEDVAAPLEWQRGRVEALRALAA